MTTSRRAIPYPDAGGCIYLPVTIWKKTLDTMRWYGKHRSEGLTYWGGVIGAGGETLVTSLLLLNHLPQGAHVQPTPAEMRALLQALRSRDEKLVAQIHSHRDQAFHSLGDSQKATSFHFGFISIVVPNFGQGVEQIFDCGVYEYRGEFDRLTVKEINQRIHIDEPIIELLPRQLGQARESIWTVLSQRLKSIGLKKH